MSEVNWQKRAANAHLWKRHEEDWYPEPLEATEALLRVEMVFGEVWDPACGGGNILSVLDCAGIECSGTDIVDRNSPRWLMKQEFLATEPAKWQRDIIISNPPFQLLQRFVDHALKCARWKVIMLARLAFLESEARAPWFERVPLARVWVFSWRLSIPPGGVAAEAKGGKVAFAWFVFEHGHRGPPQLGWLHRQPKASTPLLEKQP